MTPETISEAAIESNLKQFLLVLSISLSVATLPQIFSWFRKIPYTLLLVIVGLVLAFVNIRLINLSPQLILGIFLPPLLFEAAWNLEWPTLKRDLVPSGSGVIGVVTTGLILGNFGSCIGMQPSTRLAVTQFWDFLAFFVNSMVFLLIGDQISKANLGENLELIAVTVVAMLLSRAIAIYGLGKLSNWLAGSEISSLLRHASRESPLNWRTDRYFLSIIKCTWEP